MKKIILILVVAVMAIVVNSVVKAQPCSSCPPPTSCSIVVLQVPNCGSATFTFCYLCDPTHNASTVTGVSVQGWCLNASGNPRDFFTNWFFNNYSSYCGVTPCDQGNPPTIYLKWPICADEFYDVNTNQITEILNPSCPLTCVKVYSWCQCNCTPDCAPKLPPPCVPQWLAIELNEYTEGTGSCSLTQVGIGAKPPYDFSGSFFIQCQEVYICTP